MELNLKKALNVAGIGTGTFFIENIEIDYRYFSPVNLTNEITEEAIDGDRNTDITTFIKNENMELEVKGTFSSAFGILTEDFKEKYLNLEELRNSKKQINILGTDYDDKTWAIKSITKDDEGLNYIDFTLILRELKFVKVKRFTYDNTVRGRAEYKPPTKKNSAQIKAVPFLEDKYTL